MAYVTVRGKDQNTPSTRRAAQHRDRTRKRKRKTSGRPGRKSPEQRQQQADTIRSIRNRNLEFVTEADLPDVTGQQRSVINVLIQPNAEVLTNIQIARLAGVTRQTVGNFRGSPLYYESLAKSEIFEKRLIRLEAKALVAMEDNIEQHGDNTCIKMSLVMRQRLDEAHRNVFQISAETIQIGIGQSLKNLPSADYEVIEEKKSTQTEGEQGDSETETDHDTSTQ